MKREHQTAKKAINFYVLESNNRFKCSPTMDCCTFNYRLWLALRSYLERQWLIVACNILTTRDPPSWLMIAMCKQRLY